MSIPAKAGLAPRTSHTAEQLGDMFENAIPDRITQEDRLQTRPNFPFFLRHWPEEWSVETQGLEKPTWLPLLNRHNIIPGVNLNRTLRQGDKPESAYDLAVLTDQRIGAVYLPWKQHAYLKKAPCEDPRTGEKGDFWQEAWMKPRAARRGKRQKFRRDRATANKFRLELVLDGTVSPPEEDIREIYIERARKESRRVASFTKLEKKEHERRKGEADATLKMMVNAVVPKPREMVPAGAP